MSKRIACFTYARLCRTLIAVAVTLLNGCAAFNDTLIVDVGEQFKLIEMDGQAGEETARQIKHRGFECDFAARTQRDSLFAADRRISGHIRCHPLTSAGDATARSEQPIAR